MNIQIVNKGIMKRERERPMSQRPIIDMEDCVDDYEGLISN